VSHEAAPDPAEPLCLWATLEYDGTDFFGFQVQAGKRTVQGEVERALEAVSGEKRRITGAGRTDRGVHARGQVISFEVRWRHEIGDLHRALNALLAADVAIREMGLVEEGFHPRFSARSRRYRYTILNQPWRSPLHRRRAWHVARRLDVDRMAEASQYLVGTHDFETFGRPPDPRPGKSAVRQVLQAEWQGRGSLLNFEIEANAFLYRMVRSIVGMLVFVGWGDISPAEFRAMLEARDRSQIKQVAPAHGLCLVQVNYAAREGV
jgi:tRNA pseudouridine38-40 synthase